MHKLRLLGIIFLIGSITFSGIAMYKKNTGTLYSEYSRLFEYRILHPEFLPNPQTITLTSAGHISTYADILWINLIQYIADNVFSGDYKNFLNPFIGTITELHPYFGAPYNLALLLTPTINPDAPTYDLHRSIAQKAIEIGKTGMSHLCDPVKLGQIESMEFSSDLWLNPEIKNACSDSMLAYYMAFTYQDLGDREEALRYYKISSTIEGAPQAARFLGPLMKSQDGDYLNSAKTFLLLAVEGYDESPYLCQSSALSILEELRSKPVSSIVPRLRSIEEKLSPPKDTANPLASSSSNCYNSNIRAMKQLYLAYIGEKSLPHPEIETGDELLRRGIIDAVYTIRDQDGWTVMKKKDGIWKFAPQ